MVASSSAATIKVGPEEPLKRISDAARIARNGDTVLVHAGVYRGDVAVWRQKQLEIRSIGGTATLIADGRDAEGKAIWVIRDGDFRITGFEFTGARVKSGNGAGIRLERGRLEVSNCYFHDNQMGLLTGNDRSTELRIRDSVFANAPRQQSPLPHLLYVGRIARFELSGSRFQNGYWGHLVKSRARISELRYNLIADGPSGEASYEIDLPNGGEATLVGNIIEQSARPQNTTIVAYGAEGSGWPENTLALTHNTIINHADQGFFVRLWPEKLPEFHPPRVFIRNNLTLGAGLQTEGVPYDHGDNAHLDTPGPDEPEPDALLLLARQFRPRPSASGTPLVAPLVPASQFKLPVGTTPIPEVRDFLPGALQK